MQHQPILEPSFPTILKLTVMYVFRASDVSMLYRSKSFFIGF